MSASQYISLLLLHLKSASMMSSASIAICYKSVQPYSLSYNPKTHLALLQLALPMQHLEQAKSSLDTRDLEENPTMMLLEPLPKLRWDAP